MGASDPILDSLSAISERLLGLGFHSEAEHVAKCGRRLIRRKGQSQFYPMLCGRRFCPRCGPYRATVTGKPYQDKVLGILGPGIAAFSLTLTPPCEAEDPAFALSIAAFLRSAWNEAWWKGQKGCAKSVAVLAALEFGKSGGHPHLHLLTVGPVGSAEAVALRLQSRWMKRYPAANPMAQDFQGPIAHPEDIKGCLVYLTKGSVIQVEWPDPAIRGAMKMLTGRRRTFTACGLAMRTKKIR